MALLKERKRGDIHSLKYWFIFPKGDQKLAGEITLVHDLQWEMRKFTFLKGRPECQRDLMLKGECRFKDHNSVTHYIKIELIQPA